MVSTRLTPAEHAAESLSPPPCCGKAMARTRTWTAPAMVGESERVRQIARIGNNLNQLARWANPTGSPPWPSRRSPTSYRSSGAHEVARAGGGGGDAL